jgi:hypothetical protein
MAITYLNAPQGASRTACSFFALLLVRKKPRTKQRKKSSLNLMMDYIYEE